METVLLVVVGVVAALWIWGALQRWAWKPTAQERYDRLKDR